jgi:hypothetical protein
VVRFGPTLAPTAVPPANPGLVTLPTELVAQLFILDRRSSAFSHVSSFLSILAQ